MPPPMYRGLPGEEQALPPAIPGPVGPAPVAAIESVGEKSVSAEAPAVDRSALQNIPEVLTSTQPSHAVPGEEHAVGPGSVVTSVPPVDPQAPLAKLVEETAVLLSGEDIGVPGLLLTGKLAGEPVAVWRNGEVVPGSTPIVTGKSACWIACFLLLLWCT